MMYILLFVYICSEFRIYFFDYCFLAILARPHLFFVSFWRWSVDIPMPWQAHWCPYVRRSPRYLGENIYRVT